MISNLNRQTESNQVELLKSVELFSQILSHSQTQTMLHRFLNLAAAAAVCVCDFVRCIQIDKRQITEYVQIKTFVNELFDQIKIEFREKCSSIIIIIMRTMANKLP